MCLQCDIRKGVEDRVNRRARRCRTVILQQKDPCSPPVHPGFIYNEHNHEIMSLYAADIYLFGDIIPYLADAVVAPVREEATSEKQFLVG